MTIENLKNKKHRAIPNQFVFKDGKVTWFQSYGTKIACVEDGVITLDENATNYSNTTTRNLVIFLALRSAAELHDNIKRNKYKIKNLN
jgi:hypothetical protein